MKMLIRNLEETTVQKYKCGSPNLCKFLEKNEILPIYSYINKKNNRTIWVFNINDELSALLSEWSSNKPKRGDK